MPPEAEHLPPHHIPFSDEPSILILLNATLSLRRWSLKKTRFIKRACIYMFCCQGLCPKIRTRSYPAPLLFSCINRLGLLSCWSSSDWHRRSEARSLCQLRVRHLNKYPHFGNSLISNDNYVSPLRGSGFSKPEGWTASPVTDTTKGSAAISTSNVTPVRWQLGLSASLLFLHETLMLEKVLTRKLGLRETSFAPETALPAVISALQFSTRNRAVTNALNTRLKGSHTERPGLEIPVFGGFNQMEQHWEDMGVWGWGATEPFKIDLFLICFDSPLILHAFS